ncbi:MAG: hypothetical protein GF370_04465 [Candidatus Nealsonbacteria bacterium]|nr:hypothetical protein [Candidatus Nealsonbacteria bacterium]
MEKQNNQNVSPEAKKFLDILVPITKSSLGISVLGLPGAYVLQNTITREFPLGLYAALLLFVSSLSYFLYVFQNRIYDMEDLKRVAFKYFLVMNFLLTIVVHYLGGIEGLGFFIYTFLIVEASVIFGKKGTFLITLSAVLFYGAMAILEYLGVVPHHSFLTVSKGYQSLRYLLVHVGGGVALGLGYTAFITSRFANVHRETREELEKEREELIKAQDQLRVTRDTLEVRVRARTQELRHLTEDLEKQVRGRTKELEGKIKELENFQKFAVGREMKMVEMKQELEKLKKQLRNQQNES